MIFRQRKKGGLEERKLALINQINQINGQLHNIGQLDNSDCTYRLVQAVEYTVSSQSSRG